MTREEAIDIIKCLAWHTRPDEEDVEQAIKVLKQESCEDCINRKHLEERIKYALEMLEYETDDFKLGVSTVLLLIKGEPSVQPKPKTGHCKECKYFEYDSVAKVDGIPLIVAHEICKKWGDGCKTSEDGYCFLFEPQESEGKE